MIKNASLERILFNELSIFFNKLGDGGHCGAQDCPGRGIVLLWSGRCVKNEDRARNHCGSCPGYLQLIKTGYGAGLVTAKEHVDYQSNILDTSLTVSTEVSICHVDGSATTQQVVDESGNVLDAYLLVVVNVTQDYLGTTVLGDGDAPRDTAAGRTAEPT